MSFNIKRTANDDFKIYVNGQFAGYSDSHPMDYLKPANEIIQITANKHFARDRDVMGVNSRDFQMLEVKE